MLKLNNEGWGLSVFIVYLFVFFIALVLVASMSGKLDKMVDKQTYTDIKEEQDLQENNKNSNKNQGNQTGQNTYQRYESVVKTAAENYREVNCITVDEGVTFYVNIINLDIPDHIITECVGYVELTIGDEQAYLSCGTYKTPGYTE